MIKTTGIELWEIMKDGKDGEIFEVTSCNLSSFVGHKIKVSVKEELWESYKCLVNPDVEGEGEEALAKLYGCLGTATFKKLQQFEEITLAEAIERLNDYRLVYYRSGSGHKELSRYTDFDDLYVDDFSDLLSKQFYKKSGE
jgi:hypothetical protein